MISRAAPRTSRPRIATSTPASATDPLRFERRRAARLPAAGDLVATFRDADGRIGLTRVDLVDCSDGGLGITSPVAIEPGMTVTLRDAHTRQPWSDARAVRCYRDQSGYRVGLALTTTRLAA